MKRTLENRKTSCVNGSAEYIVNMVILLKVVHQNSYGILHRNRKQNPKKFMQKYQIPKAEKKKAN